MLQLLLLSTLGGVDAAGNQEVVLIENKGVTFQQVPNRTSYQCTFRNLWTKERQPKNFPTELARWNGPVMWTHTLQFEPWREGDAVTRGVEKVAEDGFADELIKEMQQQGEAVKAWSENPDFGFFVKEADFVHMPPMETDFQFPYLSVMAGMSPSPDWYTGFYSYWLIDEYSQTWYDHIKIQTYAWDAGTDGGTTYDSLESDLDPPQPITRFIPRTAPENGELSAPNGEDVPVVAEWECFLVVGDVDLVMPDCDWFANPCCNETDQVNCGATLPNGAPPELSPEYQEVLANSGNSDGASGAVQHFSLALFACLAVLHFILA